jgi:triosephosphate isomerase
MRGLLIAGNWKMNTDLESAQKLAAAIAVGVGERPPAEGVDVAVCPPFVSLAGVVNAVDGTSILVGGQNMSDKPSGALTGEISAAMLVSAGCRLVILGHSERRQYFGETDESVNAKCRAAQDAGLQPIVCVGEHLDEREAGREEAVVAAQLTGSLRDLNPTGPTAPVVAYEPVWAIGTGRTATPEQAQTMHRFIRDRLTELWGEKSASETRILYGGSMKPDNAKELLASPDIDGGLIGGASLDAASFLSIVQSGTEVV